MHDIVDTVVAGLADTLKGSGPFTIFAPSDAAFAKLPPGTVDGLIKPENKSKLAGILKFHVISGKVMASEVKGKHLHPASVQGENLNVDGTNGVKVNGSNVTTADIGCTNGVIHIIDTVLMPKQ